MSVGKRSRVPRSSVGVPSGGVPLRSEPEPKVKAKSKGAKSKSKAKAKADG